MRVLIGSPVRKPPGILHWFLWSLDRLGPGEAEIDWCLIDDNDDKQSSLLLANSANLHGTKLIHRPKQEITRGSFETTDTRIWRQEHFDRVTLFRETLLRQARTGGYDYLFLVDADLVLRPDTLYHLLAAEKDIISEVFWTRWHPQNEEMPNVWVADHYNLHSQAREETAVQPAEILRRQAEFLQMLREPGVYRVGGLGACTLISRRALESGISYLPLYNLTWWGEDRHFCIRAVALGFELWADTHCAPFHIYRTSDLDRLDSWKADFTSDRAILR